MMTQKRFSLDSDFEKLLNYSRVLVDGEWVFVSGCSGFNYDDMTISDSMTELFWPSRTGHFNERQ